MLFQKHICHNYDNLQAELTYPNRKIFLNERWIVINKSLLNVNHHLDETNYRDRPKGFFRGFIFGLPISILLWVIIWKVINLFLN
jgi:hypothetical protein